ncbi:MAG: hypothetical protein KA792_07780, partial [Bacteroidales bacterium]|nr:hypothetical protein [Bacteroidales bacterium]
LSGTANTVTVIAYSQGADTNVDTAYIIINYFDSPAINISSPLNFYNTSAIEISLTGTVKWIDAGDSIKILDENYNVIDTIIITSTTDSSGIVWSGYAQISQFADSIIVEVIDQWGRTAYDTVLINHFDTPTLKINPIFNMLDTNVQEIIINGTTLETSSGDTISIYVNGIYQTSSIITSYNGNWSGTALLTGIGDSVMVRLSDKFNRIAQDTIIINSFANPKIKIVSPQNNYDTSFSLISITGTTHHSYSGDTIKIYVNGIFNSSINISSINQNFSGTALITGINDSLVVELTGFAGTVYDTIILNYFSNVSLKITYPNTLNHDTHISQIIISGTTFNTNTGDSVLLYVNGIYQSSFSITSSNGIFSETVSISGNADSVLAVLTDKFGRIKYDTILINYFGTPDIKIIYPDVIHHDTFVSIITVSGTSLNLSNGDTVSLLVNGILNSKSIIAYLNSNWSSTAAVSGNYDSIAVYVTDRFNRITYDTITVKFFPGPSTFITYPVSSKTHFDTIINTVNISGTSLNAEDGDSVIIYLNGVEQSKTQTFSGVWSGTSSVILNDAIISVSINDKFMQSGNDTISVGPGFIISGNVKRVGSYDSGIILTVINDTFSFSTISSDTGFFVLRVLTINETYNIIVQKNGYKTQSYSLFISNDTGLDTFAQLSPGDFFNDGKIDIKDAAMIKKLYGTFNTDYDINDDGYIGREEKNAVIQYFEK